MNETARAQDNHPKRDHQCPDSCPKAWVAEPPTWSPGRMSLDSETLLYLFQSQLGGTCCQLLWAPGGGSRGSLSMPGSPNCPGPKAP